MPPRRRRDAPLDEQHFHRWLRRRLGRGDRTPLPLGDDTAARKVDGRRLLLVTTDALSEGHHFLPASPARSVGSAAASVSLSDLAAKGGRPEGFLLDLLLPPGTPERWARDVVEGAEARLAPYGAHVIGGDTKPARSRAVVGTLFGSGRRSHLAPHSAARVGDVLVVTGAVGRGGFDALPLKRRSGPRVAELERLLDVRPRVVEGAVLAGFVHAMIDTSDGVADSARIVAQASEKRLTLVREDLPIYPRLRSARLPAEDRWTAAFFGGDYELFAAMDPERLAEARVALRRVGCPLTVVGRVERGRGAFLSTEGKVRPLPEGGWRPFRVDR